MFPRTPCAPELGIEVRAGVGKLLSTVGTIPSLFSEQRVDKKEGDFPGLLRGWRGIPASHSPSETVLFPFCNNLKHLPSQAMSLGTSIPKTGARGRDGQDTQLSKM